MTVIVMKKESLQDLHHHVMYYAYLVPAKGICPWMCTFPVSTLKEVEDEEEEEEEEDAVSFDPLPVLLFFSLGGLIRFHRSSGLPDNRSTKGMDICPRSAG